MGAFYYDRMWVSVTPEALWIELVSRGQFMGLEWYLFYYYNIHLLLFDYCCVSSFGIRIELLLFEIVLFDKLIKLSHLTDDQCRSFLYRFPDKSIKIFPQFDYIVCGRT